MTPSQLEEFQKNRRVIVDFEGNPLSLTNLLAAVRNVMLVDALGNPVTLTGPAGADGDVLTEATPVNAIAASRLLTVAGIPAEADTVTVSGKTYKFRAAIGAAVAASKLLTINSMPAEGETIVIDAITYKIRRDVLGAGVAASAIIINNQTAPTDGDTVTVGAVVYRFKDIPAQAFDIAISTASVSTLRLFKAMTGTGIAGSDYFAGTTAIAIAATAIHTSEFVITVTANAVGFAGNLFAKAASSAVYDWDGVGAVFTGGIDAQAAYDVYAGGGTSACIDNLLVATNTGYSAGVSGTGTVAHTLVTLTKDSTQSLTATAKTAGAAGNSIAIAETLSDGASVWLADATALSGGIDAQAVNDVLIGISAETAIDNLVLAITAGANIGVKYGTGTTVNTYCTAAKASAATMTATAKIKGVAGNDLDIAKSGADLSWAGAAVFLGGGVNGTVGVKGKKVFDTTYEYLCLADNTINDANWTRKANGAIF